MELTRIHPARHAHTQHGDFVERNLGNRRQLRVGRKICKDGVDFARCILHHEIDIGILLELDNDERQTLHRRRAHIVYFVNARDRVLDDFADIVLHFVR